MKKIFLLIATISVAIICKSQLLPTLPKDWERVYIKDIGNFDLPPTMEVQKGKYKKYVDSYRNLIGFETTKLTAQQKGLNELSLSGHEKYARVMIETAFGNKGDYEKLNFNTTNHSHADISKLNSTFKQQIQQGFQGTGLKLIEWYPVTVKKINGVSCFHVSYKRQLQNNPIVLVNIYYFHNNDRMYALTLSYRVSESDYWKSDFEKILKSFRITDVIR